MSTARYRSQQPLQIYQDPETDHAPMPSTSSLPRSSISPLRPIKNASSRRNVVLNAPPMVENYGSPRKMTSSSPTRAPFANKLNMISMPPPGNAVRMTDSLNKKHPLTKSKGPQKALFTTYQSNGKENNHQCLYSTTPFNDVQDENYDPRTYYAQKAGGKRVLLEAPVLQSKKQKTQEIVDTNAHPFGLLKDDGTKPNHSYAMLIAMAILTAPGKRLTLAQIYKWISDTYSYYGEKETGWQNSIRHNLSLNKAFQKQERPKDDPGKGNYWVIAEGEEEKFTKAKQSLKTNAADANSIMSTPMAVPSSTVRERPSSSYRNSTPAPAQFAPPPSYLGTIREQQLQKPNQDISSDATIPASDSYQPDEEAPEHERLENAAVSQPILSSPPAAMQSSPPLPRHIHQRNNTPPPVAHFVPRSSVNRYHKRNTASMDDSGYHSNIPSSMLRGGPGTRQLPSEDDRAHLKRGRAEEEIARLRGSSYDSPTKTSRKTRTSLAVDSWGAPPSSSPLRRGLVYDAGQMLPPLTPAVKLKAPTRPPPSVSPNTNLRLHREAVKELLGSPAPQETCLGDAQPWSPAFTLGLAMEDPLFPDLNTEFDLFLDQEASIVGSPTKGGSPEKRPLKRPRLEHAPHSMNVLSEAGNVHKYTRMSKSITSTPRLNFTPRLAPAFDSPSKALGFGSPLKSLTSFNMSTGNLSEFDFDLPAQDDFFSTADVDQFLADNPGSEDGVDILQGFAKIGAAKPAEITKGPVAQMRRGLGSRSLSSRF